MAMYCLLTKPIIFQIKHVHPTIYPTIFYKPYFIAFFVFFKMLSSKCSHFPLPILRQLTTVKQAAILKKKRRKKQ